MQKMNNQQIAFAVAWTYAQVGKRVKLSKENGQWHVEIK